MCESRLTEEVATNDCTSQFRCGEQRTANRRTSDLDSRPLDPSPEANLLVATHRAVTPFEPAPRALSKLSPAGRAAREPSAPALASAVSDHPRSIHLVNPINHSNHSNLDHLFPSAILQLLTAVFFSTVGSFGGSR
jgi:hypothetical protein